MNRNEITEQQITELMQSIPRADEVERLRHERRQLRARLVECLPWVGHIPLPNTHLFSEMILARELAEDTLKEVKP